MPNLLEGEFKHGQAHPQLANAVDRGLVQKAESQPSEGDHDGPL